MVYSTLVKLSPCIPFFVGGKASKPFEDNHITLFSGKSAYSLFASVMTLPVCWLFFPAVRRVLVFVQQYVEVCFLFVLVRTVRVRVVCFLLLFLFLCP